MKPEINQYQRAYLAWNVLVKYAMIGESITYSELAGKLGIHHRAIRFVLDVIYNHCISIDDMPLLTGIVVGKQTRKPGMGFTDFNSRDLRVEFDKIFSFPWQNIANPFDFAKDGNTISDMVDTLIEYPDEAATVYTRIKVRGIAQMFFREALLETYNSSCCICGLTFTEALEACHIVPYSLCNSQQKLDVRNGLLLCSTHHKLFDYGYITIDPDYRVVYTDMEEKFEPYSEYDRLLSTHFNGKNLLLPDNEKHFPSKDYLQHHRESF